MSDPLSPTYSSWTPGRRDSGYVDLVEVHRDSSGLTLVLVPFGGARGLSDPDSLAFARAEIRFERCRAYRDVDEGYRTGEDIDIGDQPTSFVYTVAGSEFLAEFSKLSSGLLDDFPLIHWFVPSANHCVDVISELEPKLTLIPKHAA